MKEVKDRAPLGNGKNNIIKPAGIPSNIATVAELISFLNAGFYADVKANNTTGADTGVSEIGTPANKSLFDSIEEGIYAWPELPELDIQTGTMLLTSGWTYVPFVRAFRTAPVVNVTPIMDTAYARTFVIKGTTTQGFYCTNSQLAADTINWIAIVNNNLGV
jgi:hypothetical protein